ncbi:unnamed protein product [Pleuronectes platessa]|uniref:Uncharacterized protein n=1 Tax=Pleuronectes platessa TaxID=8262 RepID=A0A9N7YIC8_PLEPL|nr:unnamed protein product [Pleuronectes platessa]
MCVGGGWMWSGALWEQRIEEERRTNFSQSGLNITKTKEMVTEETSRDPEVEHEELHVSLFTSVQRSSSSVEHHTFYKPLKNLFSLLRHLSSLDSVPSTLALNSSFCAFILSSSAASSSSSSSPPPPPPPPPFSALRPASFLPLGLRSSVLVSSTLDGGKKSYRVWAVLVRAGSVQMCPSAKEEQEEEEVEEEEEEEEEAREHGS